MKHRIRAALIHLTLSAAIALAVFVPIYFLWYPDVLFDKAGGRALFLLIVVVDVVVGPLITFTIFVPGKKGLMFDLVVISFLQAAALTYGVYVLFESRPAYIVFVKDRFELLRANQMPASELEKARGTAYESLPMTGPKLVAARMPRDLKDQEFVVMAAFAGIDMQHFPKFYVPYESARAEVLARALPIEELRKRNRDRTAEVAAELARLGRKEDEVRFVPMRAGKVDLAVLIDAKSAEVLRIASLNPWS